MESTNSVEPTAESTIPDTLLDAGIKKTIIHAGDDHDEEKFPVDGQVVELQFWGQLEDGTQFESNEEDEEPFSFVIGQSEVIKCWELGNDRVFFCITCVKMIAERTAVMTMKKGETAKFVCPAEHAFGAEGDESRGVPAHATVTYELTLVDFFDQCKVKWDYTPEQRLEKAREFKERGNTYFRTGDYEEADFSYDQAIDYLDFAPNPIPQGLDGADEIRATSYLNQAAVYFQQANWEKVVQNCNIVLRTQPKNIKAYFRRGNARLNQGCLDEAKKDFLDAKVIDPTNKDVLASLKKIAAKESEEEYKQKETWKKMFERHYYEDAKEIYLQFSHVLNPVVFLDIAIGNRPVERILIELFKNVAPRTVENFRALCTGEKGICTKKASSATHNEGDDDDNCSDVSSFPLHYKGSKVHRIVPEFIIQAGDISANDGTGGHSIYGTETFEDEGYKINHATRGLLSMFNRGKPNTSSSQFFITLRKAVWLDGKHTVFGAIIKNLEFLDKLESVECDGESPVEAIRIVDSGEIQKEK